MSDGFTVMGAGGRIGSALVRHLRSLGHDCRALMRGDRARGSVGHLVYAIGLTSDFRSRPLDAVEAHVCRLVETMAGIEFESFVYLSSTRVYRRLERGDEEATLRVNPAEREDIYALSKLTGEAVVHSRAGSRARVVRLSNVLGPGAPSGDFVPSIATDALRSGRVVLESALESTKDYVSIKDVVEMLTALALRGEHTIYNLASGTAISHGDVVARIRELTGCTVDVGRRAGAVSVPPVSIERLRREFGFAPRPPLEEIDTVVKEVRERLTR